MFTAAEAMGLAMAVLEGHRNAADPADLVGGALAKIVRVLPEEVAGPVRAVREVSDPSGARPAPGQPGADDPADRGLHRGAAAAAGLPDGPRPRTG